MNMDNVLGIQIFDDKKIMNVLMTNDNTSDELNELLNTYRETKYKVCKSISGIEDSEKILRNIIMSRVRWGLI